MPVNADKVGQWKDDIARSVDFYNAWFIRFAPETYRTTRHKTTLHVEQALTLTSNLTNIEPAVLRQYPTVLPMLRMSTAPPIARDRLIGLAGVSKRLVEAMEVNQRVPPRMAAAALDEQLGKIGHLIVLLADKDIFPWLEPARAPAEVEVHRAATIVADRLCGAVSDPIVHNAQEQRQLASIRDWLEERNYRFIASGQGLRFDQMEPGTFAFRINVPVRLADGLRQINVPIDAIVKPHESRQEAMPLLIEAKSAGDFTNTNKRRKEEATKLQQLKSTYGPDVRYVLFLCGYFDSGYLGYEAAEGIDWVWEHRIDDLAEFGV